MQHRAPEQSTGADSTSALTQRVYINDEDYKVNQARISYLRRVLEHWTTVNEQGHQDFVNTHNEMVQLVNAGERAKQALETLRQGGATSHLSVPPTRNLAPPAQIAWVPHPQAMSTPSAATIEEVGQSSQNQASSSRMTPLHEQNLTQFVPTFAVQQGIWKSSYDQKTVFRPEMQTSHSQNPQLEGTRVTHNTQHGAQPSQSYMQQHQYLEEAEKQLRQYRQQQHIPQPQSYQFLPEPAATDTGFPYSWPYSQSQPPQQGLQQAHPASSTTSSALYGALDLPSVSVRETSGSTLEQSVTIESPETPIAPVASKASLLSNREQLSGDSQGTLASAPIYSKATSNLAPGRHERRSTDRIQAATSTSDSRLAETDNSSTGQNVPPNGNIPSSSASLTLSAPSRQDSRTSEPLWFNIGPTDSSAQPQQKKRSVREIAKMYKDWKKRGRNNSYLRISDTNTLLYKDHSGVIHRLPPTSNTADAPPQGHQGNRGNNYYRPQYPTASQQQDASKPQNALEETTQASHSNTAPVTPPRPSPLVSGSPRTPAQVDKTRLARDILRSLGWSPKKRKQSLNAEESPIAKRQQLKTLASSADQHDLVAEHADPPTSTTTGPTEMIRSVEPSLPIPDRSEVSEKSTDQETNPPSISAANELPSQSQVPPQRNDAVSLAPQASTSVVNESPSTSISVAPSQNPTPQNVPASTSTMDVLPSPMTVTEVIEISDEDSETKAPKRHLTPVQDLSTPPSKNVPPPTKEPLFLPSPETSPSRHSVIALEDDGEISGTPVGRMDLLEDRAETSVTLPSLKSLEKQPFVLVSQLPAWAKGQDGSRNVEARNRVPDPAEAAVLEQSALRLLPRPCKWRGCDAVLSSTEHLSKHVAQHVTGTKVWDGECLWEMCSKRFSDTSKMIGHLEDHALNPLICPFQGCDESFSKPRDLLRHKAREHGQGDLKPSTKPFKPRMPPSLGELPETLPGHQVEPRYISKAGLSEERHNILGEWVLRNINGPVDIGPKNAARPNVGYHEYEFLAKRASKVHQFEDLDSVEVSQLIHEGTVFWGRDDLYGGEQKHVPDTNEEMAVEAMLGLTGVE